MSILEHHFPPIIAEKYGVYAAVFLRDIYHWCSTNRNNDDCYYEGRWWTYQTIKGLCRRHTYWTKNQMEHIIKTCKEKGTLLTGHFNDDPFDRTCCYTLTDEVWAIFEGPFSTQEISEIDSKKNTTIHRKNQKCNKDKYKTKDIAEKKVPKKNPDEPDEQLLFDRFWKAYPKKKGKEAARKAWKKLSPGLELCRVMSAALDQQKRSAQWQEAGGQYIPYPSKWLNEHRWEDEPDPSADSGAVPYNEEGEDGI